MAKQTFTTGQVLTAAQLTNLQQTAMLGGSATAKTTSYTLVAADAGTVVSVNSTSATTITVNTGLFAAGDTVTIQNWGSGAVTITAGTATVNTAGSLIVPQYDGGVLYFTSASAAIYFDFVQAGAVSPLTTKGDLYTFASSDTRLAVGANGTILTADSAEATGMKWAAASGGAGNMAQIASGSWNAVGTVTLTGLSSYSEIVIVNYGLRPDLSGELKMRLNGITTGNYTFVGYRTSPAGGTSGQISFINDTLFYLSYDNMNTANASSSFSIKLTNCKSTGFTDMDLSAGFHNSTGGNSYAGKGVFTKSETISSLSMFIVGTTFNNGDYIVWGA